MTNWFKRFLYGPGGDTEAPASPEKKKQQDEALLAKGTCPDCHKPEAMIMGPEGGSATNCMCIYCRHEWNLFLMNGVTILDDLGRASEDRARRTYGWTPDA